MSESILRFFYRKYFYIFHGYPNFLNIRDFECIILNFWFFLFFEDNRRNLSISQNPQIYFSRKIFLSFE